jgi:hypothetical protein
MHLLIGVLQNRGYDFKREEVKKIVHRTTVFQVSELLIGRPLYVRSLAVLTANTRVDIQVFDRLPPPTMRFQRVILIIFCNTIAVVRILLFI